MSKFLERIRGLSQKQLAVLALRLNEELEQAKERKSAPIAVVGIGCRLPGGIKGPDAYWDFLAEGREAISEVPSERWDSTEWFDPDLNEPGKMSANLGGFLDDVAGFDAEAFGITPREAATMDPQQRLLLEVAWETLEHGGISPASLADSSTGVFVGICNSDHFLRVLNRGSDAIDAYVASGNAPSVAAGRISYTLGLTGPAMTIDTACSSSLVALHQAVLALRAGSCDLALAGGANVICEPDTMVSLSKAGMLAPDGRCKAFDAAADGFSRGEGCGVIALKRLSDAERDNDQIHAVIRGSAVNQDGRSAGLTVPSRRAQEEVIQTALADARISAEEVGYVEAHGTGTRLGDPIEIRALSSALTRGRAKDHTLIVGSAKTNFGHLESAAGIAGVIKTILALKHGVIPKHLHFHSGNPEINWSDTNVKIASEAEEWPTWADRRIAGVSSFGFSGTNAHVILESAQQKPEEPTFEQARCLPISARSPKALAAQAEQIGSALAGGDVDLTNAAATLSTGRSHLVERLAVVAGSAQDASEKLAAFTAGQSDSHVVRGRVEPGENAGVVFLCTGQGAQYPGMAKSLFSDSTVFREVIERCDGALGLRDGLRLIDVINQDVGEQSKLHQTEWTQPALYAVECGLAALWQSFGVVPSAVIGHSAGEFAAASIAGVFTLEDGLKLVAERGRILSQLPEGGAMAALFLSEEEAQKAISSRPDQVSIATVNAKDSVVISGSADGIDATLSELANAGIQGHRLKISFAAHSPMVDTALDELEHVAAGISTKPPEIPVAWNLTGGQALPDGAPDAGYWRRHLREPVRFADGMSRLRANGHSVFLEVGPHPVLSALAARDTDRLPLADRPVYLGSLRREHDDWTEISGALAGLFVNGVPVDWDTVGGSSRPRPVVLPTYPFEHKRFWIDPSERSKASALEVASEQVIPGRRLDTPDPVFEAGLSTSALPWLAEHEVGGEAMVAGPVFMAMAAGAADSVEPRQNWQIEDFSIIAPLFAHDTAQRVQTRLTPSVDGAFDFVIHSRQGGFSDQAWVKHAAGRLSFSAKTSAEDRKDIEADATQLSAQDDARTHLEKLKDLGVNLTGRFLTLDRLHRIDGEAYARIARQSEGQEIRTPFCDPGLLDGVLQAAGATLPYTQNTNGQLFFLNGIESITLRAALPAQFWCHAKLRSDSNENLKLVDVTIHSDDGAVVGQITGVRLASNQRQMAHVPDHFRIEWRPSPLHANAARHLRSPLSYEAGLTQDFEVRATRHELAMYDHLLPALDDICVAYIVQALKTLGIDEVPEGQYDASDLADRFSVVEGQRQLFARLLGILAEAGLTSFDANQTKIGDALPDLKPADLLAEAEQRFENSPEISILRRCGDALADVLIGKADPLDCLFPGGSLEEAKELYIDAPFARVFNGSAGALVKDLTADLSDADRLRVLEIGAGTGGTTGEILASLDGRAVDYTFTDVSQHFLDAAAQRFEERDGFSTGVFDIERDPETQGFGPGQYDVVLAANVLHATADLSDSLKRAYDLLAPGGVLVLLEGVCPEPWVDLTFGMTPGWWRFTDRDLRSDYPLISSEAWRALLERIGFSGIATAGGADKYGRGGAQQMLISAQKPATPRRIAVIDGTGALGNALADVLAAEGAEVVDDMAAAQEVIDLSVLQLEDLDETEPNLVEAIENVAVLEPLTRLRQVSQTVSDARYWVATSGVNAIRDKAIAKGARWQSPTVGLGRVAALEIPRSWGGIIDIDPTATTEAQATSIAHSVLFGNTDDHTAWRDGTRYVPRLAQFDKPEPVSYRLDADGCYLIIGGFGGIGAAVARALAERGAGRVALLGRNPDEDSPVMDAVRQAGADVVALKADVSDPASLARALDQLKDGPPIRGAFHAAAHLDAAPLAELDSGAVQAMLRPKVAGTLALEKALADRGAKFLVLFSSTTAVLGAPGFAHYAAANAFLDASDTRVTDNGLRVVSIGWGTWETMRLATEDAQRTYSAQGLNPMRAEAAIEAMFDVLEGNGGHSLVAAIDWSRLISLHETRRARPMLSDLGREDATKQPEGEDVALPESSAEAWAVLELHERLAEAPEATHLEIIEAVIADEAAAVMGKSDGASVPRNRGLFDMGMDSLMSVELRGRLEGKTGLSLPATLTFNHPTVDALSRFIQTRLQTQVQPNVVVDPVVTSEPETETEDMDAIDEDDLVARLRARLAELP